MEQKIVYNISEKDIEMLKRKRRRYPCTKCGNSIGCCGCELYRKYKAEAKEYNEAGLMDIARQIDIARDNEAKIKMLALEQKETLSQIPSDVKDALGDFWNEFDATLGKGWQDRVKP